MSMLQPNDSEEQASTTAGDVVEDAVTHVVARMHGIEAGPTSLGPVLTSEVEVDGSTAKALLDTGSPVSIISLDYFLQTQGPIASRLGKRGAQAFTTIDNDSSQLWGSRATDCGTSLM